MSPRKSLVAPRISTSWRVKADSSFENVCRSENITLSSLELYEETTNGITFPYRTTISQRNRQCLFRDVPIRGHDGVRYKLTVLKQ